MLMIGGNTQPRKFKWWFDQRVPLLIKFGADPSNAILGVITGAMRKSQLSKSKQDCLIEYPVRHLLQYTEVSRELE